MLLYVLDFELWYWCWLFNVCIIFIIGSGLLLVVWFLLIGMNNNVLFFIVVIVLYFLFSWCSSVELFLCVWFRCLMVMDCRLVDIFDVRLLLVVIVFIMVLSVVLWKLWFCCCWNVLIMLVDLVWMVSWFGVLLCFIFEIMNVFLFIRGEFI